MELLNNVKIPNWAGVVLTTYCPIECEHCQYSCNSLSGEWMPKKIINSVATQLYDNNIEFIFITGGEPFLNLERLDKALNIFLRFYTQEHISIATSGFWATNEDRTIKTLKTIVGKSNSLQLSFDRFHLKKVTLPNILRILKYSEKIGIQVVLRPLLDRNSAHLVDILLKIRKEFQVPLLFNILGSMGRAEKMSKELINDKKLFNLFHSKIQLVNESQKSEFNTNITTPTATSLTAFPNGNVYFCCNVVKLMYLGNIRKENIMSMIMKFKKSLIGSLLFYNNFNCSYLKNLLPQNVDACEFCKDHPLRGKINNETVGRKFIKINIRTDMEKLIKKLLTDDREYIISFELIRTDLNRNGGKNMEKILNILRINKIRFVLSRPLPPCLGKIKIDENKPRNCFECRELFTVNGASIILCPHIYDKKLEFEKIIQRDGIYKEFKLLHDKMRYLAPCNSCFYRVRKECDGLCFKIN